MGCLWGAAGAGDPGAGGHAEEDGDDEKGEAGLGLGGDEELLGGERQDYGYEEDVEHGPLAEAFDAAQPAFVCWGDGGAGGDPADDCQLGEGEDDGEADDEYGEGEESGVPQHGDGVEEGVGLAADAAAQDDEGEVERGEVAGE